MKTFAQKVVAAGVGIFLAASVASYGSTLYSDTATDTGTGLSFTNGVTIGQQITMTGAFTADTLTNFSFELYSTNAFLNTVSMDVMLLTNNGALFNGYASPSTSFYDSGVFTLQSPTQTAGSPTNVERLTFDLTTSPAVNMSIPTNFTLAFTVTGLGVGTNVAVELFGLATVGQNNGDYWLTNANVGGGWILETNGASSIQFGAQFLGTGTSTIPEPSVIYLGAVGMVALVGAVRLRRKK